MIGGVEALIILFVGLVTGITAGFQARRDLRRNRIHAWGGMQSLVLCAIVFGLLAFLFLLATGHIEREFVGVDYQFFLLGTVVFGLSVAVLTFCVGLAPALAGYAIASKRLLSSQSQKSKASPDAMLRRSGDPDNPYQSPGSSE